jgi:hypothetical protein
MRSVRGAAAILLLAVPLLSCGRKGPPRPPEDILPATISDLSAVSVPNGVQLSWSRPSLYADGSRMTDLAGFVVNRAVGDPAGALVQSIADLEVSDRNRFRQIKHFRYLDTDTIVGIEYRYQVVSYTLDGYFSASSNTVTIQREAMTEERHAPLPTPQR